MRARSRTLRHDTAAELMLTSPSPKRNGRNLGQPRLAPAMPVVGASAEGRDLAAHRL